MILSQGCNYIDPPTETPWIETPLSRDPPGQRPPVNSITDRCKNITLPQLRLRAVKMDDINSSRVEGTDGETIGLYSAASTRIDMSE